MPIVCLNRHHHLVEHIPYYEHWFLDRYSALSNTLKRLSMFYRYYHSLTRTDNADEQLMRQEIYWRLLWRMNDVVQESGSKLAVICLEDEHDKNHKLDIPTPEELAKMNSEGETLSFPPPFFYGFAGNGRNGEPDGPQFHVGGTDFVGCYGQMLGHPVPAMHKVWAENIAKMIPELIRNS